MLVKTCLLGYFPEKKGREMCQCQQATDVARAGRLDQIWIDLSAHTLNRPMLLERRTDHDCAHSCGPVAMLIHGRALAR
jgi:hypothetical protein